MQGHPGGHPEGGSGHPGGHPGGFGQDGFGGDVFQRQYAQGTAPWDIGRPQPAFVALEDAGKIAGRVLDIGCGTGELALFLAERGHEAVGIDQVAQAIDRAREKAVERGLDVRFEVADVLKACEPDFPDLAGPFDTLADVGFYHAVPAPRLPMLLEALSCLLKPGGLYRFLCFSDKVPGTFGPRRVTGQEIRETFSAPGWRLVELEGSTLQTNVERMPEIPAWMAAAERTAG